MWIPIAFAAALVALAINAGRNARLATSTTSATWQVHAYAPSSGWLWQQGFPSKLAAQAGIHTQRPYMPIDTIVEVHDPSGSLAMSGGPESF